MKFSDSLKRASTRPETFSTHTWDDEQFAKQRDDDLSDREIDARWAVWAVAFCLLVSALLSSGRLVDMAEGRPFGPSRTVLVEATHGVDRVSNFLSLNRPADAIASIRGGATEGRKVDDLNELAAQFEVRREATDSTVPTTTMSLPPTSTAPATSIAIESESPTGTTLPPSTTLPPRTAIREVTAESPLPVLVVGDSQAEIVAQSLIETAANRGGVLVISNEAERATGLARPDTFNWPAQLNELVLDQSPELVVVMMGGNDDWDMDVDGERFAQGTDAWAQEYAFRVSLLTNVAAQNDAHVLWILYPPIRDGRRDDITTAANAAITAALAGREDASVFDAHEMFAGPNGGYEVFFENDLGASRAMRAADGVHFTRSGSNWLSRELYLVVAQLWDITPTA